MRLRCRNSATCAQRLYFARVESQLLEDLVIVLSNLWSALGGYLLDTMHLKWATDGGCELSTRAIKRNDDVVCRKLWIVDDFPRVAHCAERHMDALEYFVPILHRLRAKHLVQDGRKLWHVLHHLRRNRKSWIGEEVWAPNRRCHGRQFVGGDNENEPCVVSCAIDIHRRICGVLAIMQSKEFGVAQCGLDRDARRPYASGK